MWMTYNAKEIEQLIIKLAKAGNKPSKIGLVLRDSYGIPSVRAVTKSKIGGVLEKNKIKPELPEDLTNLIKKELAVLKHMEKNKHDMTSKRGLQLTESKIRRLTKYYKRVGRLPKDWKYDLNRAKLIVQNE